MDSNITGNKLTHMTHIEDMLLLGPAGISIVLNTLNDVFHALEGESTKSNIKLKIDGAPSCLCASDFNGLTFVATKGFFSKERRYVTTEEECDVLYGHAPELAEKMKALLRYLPSISIPHNEIWQGDFLFSKKDLNYTEDGNITFKPNTIVYSIPVDDPIGHLISEAEIGVAWHTRYTGSDFDNLKISFDANVDNINTVPQVFQMDPRLPSIIGTGTLTLDETLKVSDILDQLGYDLRDLITSPIFPIDNDLQLIINTYRNSQIRSGSEEVLFDKVREAIINKFDLEASKMKTEKGRDTKEAKKQSLLTILDQNKESYIKLFELQKKVATLKNFFVRKLNTLGSFKTLVQHIDKGYLPCGQEGFAVSDAYGNVVKLVSRLEFSANNFSKEIVKGWTSEKREAVTGNSFTESFVGKDLLYKWAIVDSPDEIDEKLYKDLIKEATDNIKRNREEEFDIVNEFLKSTEILNSRKMTMSTSHDYDVFSEVIPVEDINRQEASEEFQIWLDKNNFDYTFRYEGKRPVYVVSIPREDKSTLVLRLDFKDKNIRGATNAAGTEAMETIWANSLYRYLHEDINEISLEELEEAGLDKSWKIGIEKGNEALAPLFNNDVDYTVNRMNYTTNPNQPSLHIIINKAAKGRQKDTWNPSDIYVYNTDIYDSFKEGYENLLNNKASLDEINAYLYKYLISGDVIGISLKKPGKTPEIEYEGYDPNNTRPPITSYKFLSNIRMPSPSLDSSKGVYFEVELDNRIAKSAYRSFGNANPQYTATYTGKKAMNGKYPVNEMLNLLAKNNCPIIYSNKALLENRDFLVQSINSILPLLNKIEVYNSKIFINGENKPKVTFFSGEVLNSDSVKDFLNSIINSPFESLDYNSKYYTILYCQLLSFVFMIINSIENNTFLDLIDNLDRLSSKSDQTMAPYIKVY